MQIGAVHPRVLAAACLAGVAVFGFGAAATLGLSGAFAVSTALMGAGLGAGLAVIVGFHGRLWRTRLGRFILPTPDFAGRWEGWHASDAGDDWRPAAHEISQVGERVSVVMFSGGARADAAARTRTESLACAIRIDPDARRPELHWFFRAARLDATGPAQDGAQSLGLFESAGAQFLDGIFVSSAARQIGGAAVAGATGRVLVKRAKGRPRGALDYREEEWAMPRPQGPPALTDTDDLIDVSIRTPVSLMGPPGDR